MSGAGGAAERIQQIPVDRRTEVIQRLREEAAGQSGPSGSLSVEQRQMWSLHSLQAGDQIAYNLSWLLRLRGPVSTGALISALADVTTRHTVLRERIYQAGDVLRPVAVPTAAVWQSVEFLDLARGPVPEREAALREAARSRARRTIDITSGFPWRAAIFTLGLDRHALLWVVHEIAFDTASRDMFFTDLAIAYAHRLAHPGHPTAWPEPAWPYARYAEWQQRWTSSAAAAEALDRWRRELDGFDGTEMPFDQAYSLYDKWLTSHGNLVVRALPGALAPRLRSFAARHGTGPLTVLRTAHAVLLHRLTGHTDIAVGLRCDNRPQGARPAIGNFENIVPSRVDLSGEPSFLEAMRRIALADERSGALAGLPYALIAEAVDRNPVSDRVPLLMTAVALADPPALPRFGEATATAEVIHDGTARLDLTLDCQIAGDDLVVSAEYSSPLFRPASAGRFLDRFAILLGAMIDDPSEALSGPSLLTAGEAELVVRGWNPPETPAPARTPAELFAAQARKTPARLAVWDESGTALSYEQLGDRVAALATRLTRLGIGPESPCAVLMERSAGMIVAILAVLEAGGVFVPVDHLTTPPDRVGAILRDCAAAAVITSGQTERLVPPGGPWLMVRADGAADDPGQAPALGAPARARPHNLAYVLYTSGSTGQPKGVMIENASVAAFATAARDLYRLTGEDQFIQFASVSFDVLIFDVFTALSIGATLHIASDDTRGSLDRFRALMRSRRVSVLMSTPTILQLLAPEDFPDLRVLAVGGEPYPAEFTNRWSQGRRFVNSYGPTEATCGCVVKECTGTTWRASPPIGQAMTGHQAYVLDARMRPVPVGMIGELYVAGAGLARGYLGQPAMTAAAFVPDPFCVAPGGRLYRTGDLARWTEDGDLVFLGRADRQVKIRGMRVEPGEIEQALRRHPNVTQAAVVPAGQAATGIRLVAFVVLRDPTAALSDLRATLVPWLPPSMLPSAFVPVAEIPLTSGGKVDRKALATLADDGLPGDQREVTRPRTPLEARLATEIVQPILGAGPVGVDENFFELGVNSLHVLQILGRVRSVLGAEIRVGQFFQVPTVAGLAAMVAEQLAEEQR